MEKEKLEKIQKELEEIKCKCEEYLNGWKRERADFTNYKKEEVERISEVIKYANQEIVFKMLPILDSIYLAEKQVPEEQKDSPWVKGFLQTQSQILEFLKKEGIEQIKSIGEKFDPNLHEVFKEIEAKDTSGGIVIEEVQKGYLMNNRTIRPAKVIISK